MCKIVVQVTCFQAELLQRMILAAGFEYLVLGVKRCFQSPWAQLSAEALVRGWNSPLEVL